MITLRPKHIIELEKEYISRITGSNFKKSSYYKNGNQFLEKTIDDLIKNKDMKVKLVTGPDYICKLCNNSYDCKNFTYNEKLLLKLYDLQEGRIYTSKELLDILNKRYILLNQKTKESLEEKIEGLIPLAFIAITFGATIMINSKLSSNIEEKNYQNKNNKKENKKNNNENYTNKNNYEENYL